MLAVVEHQQEIALMEEADDLLRRRPLAAVPQTEGVGDRRDDQSGVAYGGEVNPDHAIGEVLGDVVSKRLSQARLANTTRAGKCHERDGLIQQQSTGVGELRLTTDEANAW